VRKFCVRKAYNWDSATGTIDGQRKGLDQACRIPPFAVSGGDRGERDWKVSNKIRLFIFNAEKRRKIIQKIGLWGMEIEGRGEKVYGSKWRLRIFLGFTLRSEGSWKCT